MPVLPWILSGVITDTDNITTLEGATVKVTNIRSGEQQTDTTESDGSYSFTFTSYLDKDPLLVEAKKEESGSWVKYGFNSTTVDTGLAGRNLNITLDKYADRAELDAILRKPFQERQDLAFSPQFNAMRVLPTGFDKAQTSFTRNASNFITEMRESDGIHTKVTTITRDSNNYITSIAERIE